jgi:hypothetical protein
VILSFSDSYRLSVSSPLHWLFVILASIGLVISCLLIYRRFTAELSDHKQSKLRLNFGKRLQLFLLFFGNTIAFISVLLFVLPFEVKVQASSFDVLLTPGFEYSASNDEFNIAGMSHDEIQQQLNSAEHVWFFREQQQQNNSGLLYQWLVENYQDKVIEINSVQELVHLWQAKEKKSAQSQRFIDSKPLTMKVLGDGLTTAQWQYLSTTNEFASNKSNAIAFLYFASARKTGLKALNWSRQLLLGQPLTVTGQLQQTMEKNIRYQLSLRSHDIILDSVILSNSDTFSLTTTSKIPGLFNYQLVLRELPAGASKPNALKQDLSDSVSQDSSSQNLAFEISEDIAFSVGKGSELRVLIKQSAPSFETRRLKQWLGQTNSQVHVISKISKNNWAEQKVNMTEHRQDSMLENQQSNQKDSSAGLNTSKVSSNTNQQQYMSDQEYLLNADLLINYDLVIIDSRMLLALEMSEVDALYYAVTQGLGLLINADSKLLEFESLQQDKRNKLLSLFKITPANELSSQVVARWPDKPSLGVSETLTPQPATIGIDAKAGQAIVESTIGQALVVKQALGLGAVAISALNKTYQWSLQADSALYSHYWQYLLAKISRNENRTRWMSPAPTMLPRVGQYQNICLISPIEKVSTPNINLHHEPLSSFRKCGTFTAHQKGWFMVKAFAENQTLLAEQARYFYANSDFLAWQQANKYNASVMYANESYAGEKEAKNERLLTSTPSAQDTYQLVNKLYIWLILFLSLALLWIERKWRTG